MRFFAACTPMIFGEVLEQTNYRCLKTFKRAPGLTRDEEEGGHDHIGKMKTIPCSVTNPCRVLATLQQQNTG